MLAPRQNWTFVVSEVPLMSAKDWAYSYRLRLIQTDLALCLLARAMAGTTERAASPPSLAHREAGHNMSVPFEEMDRDDWAIVWDRTMLLMLTVEAGAQRKVPVHRGADGYMHPLVTQKGSLVDPEDDSGYALHV